MQVRLGERAYDYLVAETAGVHNHVRFSGLVLLEVFNYHPVRYNDFLSAEA